MIVGTRTCEKNDFPPFHRLENQCWGVMDFENVLFAMFFPLN
jgi:hypothetical protein